MGAASCVPPMLTDIVGWAGTVEVDSAAAPAILGQKEIRKDMDAEPISGVPASLSWEAICRRYPNEWVVLVNMDWIDADNGEFRAAIVLAHGPSREATMSQVGPAQAEYPEFAHRYTGRRGRYPSIRVADL